MDNGGIKSKSKRLTIDKSFTGSLKLQQMLLPNRIFTLDIQNCDQVATSVVILIIIKGVKKDWSI